MENSRILLHEYANMLCLNSMGFDCLGHTGSYECKYINFRTFKTDTLFIYIDYRDKYSVSIYTDSTTWKRSGLADKLMRELVLEQLSSVGFKPAQSYMREHKINNLLLS